MFHISVQLIVIGGLINSVGLSSALHVVSQVKCTFYLNNKQNLFKHFDRGHVAVKTLRHIQGAECEYDNHLKDSRP